MSARRAEAPFLGWRMLVGTVVTGAAAGAGGALLTLLLHAVQHLSFGYTENSFLTGVERASPGRRVSALAVGGAVVGVGWWALSRVGRPVVGIEEALSHRHPRVPAPAALADAVLQIVAVGIGASLGREGAPRQVGAVAASWLADLLRLAPAQRRTLIAAGAGAGLAAVYNVPLGGALFAVEILLASAALTDVIPAVLSCGLATALAWTVLGDQPTYQLTVSSAPADLLLWAVLFGPVAGLAARGFNSLMVTARTHAPAGWRLPVAVLVVFTVLGVTSIRLPQLLGNGKGPAQLAFEVGLTLPMFALLVLAKPVATAACLASGARGGLLTPAFATGAMLGALAGGWWLLLFPGGNEAAFALIGAAAMLAATQRAPLTAIVLVGEFTRTGQALIVPTVIAVALAVGTEHVVAHRSEPSRT